MTLQFREIAATQKSRARAGIFRTLHGEILTPLFMPVGTQASVRNVPAEQLAAAGSQILLANTYHLLLRPGKEVFERLGGIHNFMKWQGSVLTDSGGYQVFSLSQSRKVSEEGVTFASYVDGALHLLSPENSIAMQKAIGSDIMMAMDVCIPSTSEFTESQKAMEQTHRWALRSLTARGTSAQAIFGIVQGACHEKLRIESAKFINSLAFDGLAIGGLAVGETKTERERFTELACSYLSPDRPRYLMGVGTPLDLLEGVHRGIDMFDCIIPTQFAEQGNVFTSTERIQLARGIYKFAEDRLDPGCACPTCATYSRAYLHHLVKTCEPLSTQLLGTHNIWFYHSLMNKIRSSILNGSFLSFYNEWRERLDARDVPRQEAPTKVGRRPSRRPHQLGAFELVAVSDEAHSIRHVSSKEVMHPGKNPMDEAEQLYVQQAKLVEKVEALKENEELILWDVGLGAGFNAMAVVHALKNAKTRGRLKMLSFERDLDALRLALYHPTYFPHLRHGGPHSLLEKKTYENENLSWELVEGDFLERFTSCAIPDLIFFDPFSSKTDTSVWTLDSFQKLFEYLKSSSRNCRLQSYTASTAIRARLLMAGFFVARGQASPPKAETTLAFTKDHEEQNLFLGKDWLEKLSRSGAYSEISELHTSAHIDKAIALHPQFLRV